jgi:excisionase family DNA binding protein
MRSRHRSAPVLVDSCGTGRQFTNRTLNVGHTQGQTRSRWATSPASSHHLSVTLLTMAVTPGCDAARMVSVSEAEQLLGVSRATLYRWLADGFIVGEQPTPGAPWRIRVTDQLRARFVEQAPQGWLPMLEATKALGVSRQTVLQRVKRGELRAVHVRTGRRKGLRIEVAKADGGLFNALASTKGAV